MTAVVAAPTQATLAFWAEHKRGMPNALARCSLFKVGSYKQKRQYREDLVLTSSSDYKVIFTGFELRQDDADVFLQLLHLQRETPFDQGVEFYSTVMLKTLGRSVNTNYTQRLMRSLTRMQATSLRIQNADGSAGYAGALIPRFAWKDDSSKPLRRWKVWFDPKIVNLFDWASYSIFDWSVRLSLGPLAKWLHLYYSSHKKPHAIKVETLMQMCGSDMRSMAHFRAEIKDSLDELVQAKFLKSYSINPDRDTVFVERASKRLASSS